jgi:anti-anti-sigma factor
MTMTLEEAVDHSFQIAIDPTEGGYLIVLSGELDISTASMLRHQLDEVTAGPITNIVLDISLLTFIDSTGLSLIVAEHKKLKAMGAALTVFSPTPMTRRLFEISGLTSILSIDPSNDQ